MACSITECDAGNNPTESLSPVQQENSVGAPADFIVLLEEISAKYRDKLVKLKHLEETAFNKIQKAYESIVAVNEDAQHELPVQIPTHTSIANSMLIPTVKTSLLDQPNNAPGTCQPISTGTDAHNSEDEPFNTPTGSNEKEMFYPFLGNNTNTGNLSMNASLIANGTPKKAHVTMSSIDDSYVYDKLYYKLTSKYAPFSRHKELWQKQVTVPEPFKLTGNKHHVSKGDYKKSNIPVNSRSRPNPVPAIVKLPLYELMKEDSERKREQRIDEHKQKLIATVRPFNLSNTNICKRNNWDSISKRPLKVLKDNNVVKKPFHAKALPKYFLSRPASDTTKDLEEVLREIRVQSRSNEMLKQSALPFSGEAIIRKWNSMGSLRKKETKISPEDETVCQSQEYLHIKNKIGEPIRKHHPTVTRQKYVHEFESDEKEVEEPQVHEDEMQVLDSDAHVLPINGSNLITAANCSRTRHTTIKSTRADLLRVNKVRQMLEKESMERKAVLLQEKERKTLEQQGQNKFGWRFTLNDHLLYNEANINTKIRNHWKTDKTREQEYNDELENMKERVKNRPTLLEKQEEVRMDNGFNGIFSVFTLGGYDNFWF